MPQLAPWIAQADEALTRAARGIHLLAAATPTNAEAERARLCDAVTRNAPLLPAWIYAPQKLTDVRERLEKLENAILSLGDDPLAKIYLARTRELAIEAALVEAVGTSRFESLASARFKGDSRSASEARALAKKWTNEKKRADASELVACDADHPDSLLSLMKREVGKRALPFRVSVHAALSSLAATGDGVIYVTTGRPISKASAVRTVLHEIEGHALPRVRAGKRELAIFRIGTARGIDDQEGLALTIEDRAGFLVGDRKRDLAARALAVDGMRNGGNFAEIVMLLQKSHAQSVSQAVTIAERIFRGSDGTRPGLGRECVYLESFIRVGDRLATSPGDERVLACGQISVDAIDTLRAHAIDD